MEFKENGSLPVTKTQRRREKREQKKQAQLRVQRQLKRKKVIKILAGVFLFAALLAGAGFLFSRQGVLPPTTATGHVERSPADHIVDEPMDVRVHKHMLEHADGSGPPGVIINYNCEDYECAPDLISQLTALVNEYPDNVYLAPYPNLSAKLVVTRLGQQEIMDEFDVQRLRNFITQQ